MARVVPSQVVAFIDEIFSWPKHQKEGEPFNLAIDQMGNLKVLADLTESVPEQLLTTRDAQKRHFLWCSVSAIRTRIEIWQAQGNVGRFDKVPGLPDFHPVTLIRQA